MSETAGNTPVLHSFDVMKNGTVRQVQTENISVQVPQDVSYRWVHVDISKAGAKEVLEAVSDDFIAESLMISDTRPRCSTYNSGFLLNLRGVNLNPGEHPEDMVSIRIWFSKNIIVSARLRRLAAVVALKERMEVGDPPSSVGAFITALAQGLTERMGPVISDLGDQADQLEDASLEAPKNLKAKVTDLRRTTIALRRYIAPQREALSRLSTDAHEWLAGVLPSRLRETIDQVTRMVEEMDAIRERCSILSDQMSDRRAEEMNRNMLVLSVVAAVFLPLGFLTGLLGVNVGGIPGADYPPAFIIVCSILTFLGGTLFWWFKKSDWI